MKMYVSFSTLVFCLMAQSSVNAQPSVPKDPVRLESELTRAALVEFLDRDGLSVVQTSEGENIFLYDDEVFTVGEDIIVRDCPKTADIGSVRIDDGINPVGDIETNITLVDTRVVVICDF